MASLQKLSIRGVRSFSPEDDEQVIEFYSPLTIIVGANGCGKTTIIESLKYAVTGALPPGVRSGQSFIHDPRSINQSSVKASIKLRFTNKAGRTMVVIRSMEVTQKKTTLTFKALDGVLRSTSSTGEKVSLSHKCSELDRQIPELIGVSKPILEHVVFCHQEDSSWPLQEGAVLKKRFDEIFDSTRYAKALEAIRKSKTEYTALKNKINADLEGLKAHKHAADALLNDLDETEDKLKNLDEKKEAYNDQIESEEGKKKVFEETLQGVTDLSDQLHQRKKALEQANEIARTLQGMLEEELVDVDEDTLRQMLSEFDDKVGGMEGSFKEKLENFEKLKKTLSDLQSDRIDLCSRRGTLNAAAEQNQMALVQRDSLITALAQKHEVALPSGATDASSLNPNQLKVALASLKSKETEFSARLSELKKSHQLADDDVQTRLGALLAESKHIETSLSANAAKTRELNNSLTAVATQSQSDRRISKAEVDDCVREAEQLAEERDKLSGNTRLGVIPKDIKENEKKVHAIQLTMEELEEALEQLRQCSDEENAVTILDKQVQQEVFRLSESCKDLQHRYPNFSDDLGGISATDLPTLESAALAVSDRAASIEQDLSSRRESHAAKEREVTQKATLLKHNGSKITDLSTRIADLRAAGSSHAKVIAVAKSVREEELSTIGDSVIPEDLESVDVEALLGSLQDCLKAIDIGMELFSPESVKKFIKRLKKLVKVVDDEGAVQGAKCPCCHNDFGGGSEGHKADEYHAMLENFATLGSAESPLIKVPNEADKAKKQQFEENIATITSSLGDWSELKRLEKELSDLKKVVETDKTKVGSFKTEAEALKREIETVDAKLVDVERVKVEVLKLRDTGTRIKDKQSEVEQKKSSLAAFAPSSEGKTLRQVEKEIKEGSLEKDELMRATQDLNKEMAHINRNLQVATTRASQAEKVANEKRALYAQYGENETKRVAMREELAKCNEIERELSEKEAPVRQKLQEVEAEKTRMREASGRKEEELSEEAAAYSRSLAEVHSYHAKMEQFKEGGMMKELDDLNAEIAQAEKKIAEVEDEVKMKEPEIAEERSKMGDRSRQKKILADNISFRESMAKVAVIEEEVKEIDAEIGKFEGQREAEEGYEISINRIEELNTKKHRLDGKVAALTDQAQQLKGKLNSSTYKGVEERYRQCMISFETTKIAVTDLDKYFQAVDKALLRYHSLKIGDINKIIKELWSLTYKGADITNIKIESGSDSKAKRSYNYRVVMSKGGTEMDMRGRCSAGQRVLASIVIRLALAETFCISCGVLALDEPTTNLDHENKRGLSMALAQIIANRSGQHNFQILAITHDEDFCDMLKNELASVGGNFSMPDSYFYVHREEGADAKHYSKIDKVSWDEL